MDGNTRNTAKMFMCRSHLDKVKLINVINALLSFSPVIKSVENVEKAISPPELIQIAGHGRSM